MVRRGLAFWFAFLMEFSVFALLFIFISYLMISLVRWGVWYVQFDLEDSLFSEYVEVAESRPGPRQQQLLYVKHDGEILGFVSYLDAGEKLALAVVSEPIVVKFYMMPMGGSYVYHVVGANTGKIYYDGKPTRELWMAFVALFVILLSAVPTKYLYGNLRRDLYGPN